MHDRYQPNLKKTIPWLLVALATLALFGGASAQESPLNARMIVDKSAVAAGEELWVGIHIQLQPGWHIYWENPGDSGFATKIEWDLADVSTTSPETLYPVPIKFIGAGNVVSYGYEKETVLLAHVPRVALKPDARQVTLRAKGRWLMCQAEECRDGRQTFELTIPVGPASPSPDKDMIDKFRRRVPKEGQPKNLRVESTVMGDRVKVRLEVLPPGANQKILAEDSEQGRGLAFFPLPPKGVTATVPEITGPKKVVRVGNESLSLFTDKALVTFEIKRNSRTSTGPLTMAGVLVQQTVEADSRLGELEAKRFRISIP
ncbi:MAG: protein-disulfide reductase DsbD domain-containing protein [Candidatus Sumerlaeaceae bacterium]